MRNAIFQTSAALEEYIRGVLEDWVHLLRRQNKKLSDVPSNLTFWHAGKKQKTAFLNFIIDNDEGKFINNMQSLTGLSDIFDNSVEVKNVFNNSEHVRDRKYPSMKNINILFKRFGIDNIFRTIQIKGKKDYKRLLRSFSDIRTEIAHSFPSSDISYNDVKHQLEEINNLVSKLDLVLYSHVLRNSGLDCWKTNIS